MLVISSREFRNSQKRYLDIADNNGQVIIQRGKDKAYILTPISDADKLSFNPKLASVIEQAEKAKAEGKFIHINDPKKIWKDIL